MPEKYYLVSCSLDQYIPFCDVFIIPYLIWFPYQFGLLGYFLWGGTTKEEFYRFFLLITSGMTFFLVVSFFYPTRLDIRPEIHYGTNLFQNMIYYLYKTDPPANVLPSIHVFNSIVFHIAYCRSKEKGKDRLAKRISFVIMMSIVVSTGMIKQHSVIDILAGILMAGVGYVFVYRVCRRRDTVQEEDYVY